MKTERRFIGSKLELRANGEGKMPTVRAYAIVYDQKSENLGSTMWEWYEICERGCASDTIKSDPIVGLFNHSPDSVMGATYSSTLRVGEDNIGIWFEADLPDTTWARDLVKSIERGDIRGCSFAFETLTEKWEILDGKEVRRLIKIRLYDVSVVTFPAYPATNGTVGLRSILMTQSDDDMTLQDYAEHRKKLQENAPDPMASLNLRAKALALRAKHGRLNN